jgi:hypothetical protein
MPRYSNFPTLIDELRSFSISDLKQLGHFKNRPFVSGTMNWRNRYDEVTSTISLDVNNSRNNKYVQLSYNCNDEKMNYKVNIVTMPSNLGKGNVLYFICSFTNQRCRKLHLINGKFMHRSALSNPLYSKQIESKRWRELNKLFGAPFELEKLHDKLWSKGFKKYYKGKPTKKFQKLLNQIEMLEKAC